MKHKGRITVSRKTSNLTDDCIGIEIQDKSSGIRFVSVEMTLEHFAQAVTGVGYLECEFELTGASNVGKRLEHKVVAVRFAPQCRDNPTAFAEAMAPFHVDGWTGGKRDDFNHHNLVHGGDGNTYNVTLHRFV